MDSPWRRFWGLAPCTVRVGEGDACTVQVGEGDARTYMAMMGDRRLHIMATCIMFERQPSQCVTICTCVLPAPSLSGASGAWPQKAGRLAGGAGAVA